VWDLICWAGVFIADELDGIGDKVLGYTTTVAFLNMSWRSASNTD